MKSLRLIFTAALISIVGNNSCGAESILDLGKSFIIRGTSGGLYLPNKRPILVEDPEQIKEIQGVLFDVSKWDKISILKEEPKYSSSSYFYFIRDRKIIALVINSDTLIAGKTLYKLKENHSIDTLFKILKKNDLLTWVSTDEAYDFRLLEWDWAADK